MKKLVFVTVIITSVALAIGCLYLQHEYRPIIIDPYHPRFDPYKFKFSDYTDTNLDNPYEWTCNIVQAIITVDQKKSEVDKILVESGGAKVSDISSPDGTIIFSYKNPVVIGKYSFLNLYTARGQRIVVNFSEELMVNSVSCEWLHGMAALSK